MARTSHCSDIASAVKSATPNTPPIMLQTKTRSQSVTVAPLSACFVPGRAATDRAW
jgi:hypothetical protein